MATGAKFQITHQTTEELVRYALKKTAGGGTVRHASSGVYADGAQEAIMAVSYNYGGFNNYSKTKGLWNKRLGLTEESLEETIRRVCGEQSVTT